MSAWLVQMLEVACSRRMCCSRVCRVRVKARRPEWSRVIPTSRPGRRRTSAWRAAMKPTWGPPKDGGRAVVHRGVSDVEGGERADHRLELEDRLERALRRLGLVRGVRRVELRPRHRGAHDRGDEAAVDAGAEEGVHLTERTVARRQ